MFNVLHRQLAVSGGSGVYTIEPSDQYLRFDTTSRAAVATFPLFSTITNQTFFIQKITGDANTLTIETTSPDTFPGGATSFVLTNNTTNGSVLVKIPGDGSSPCMLFGAGSSSTDDAVTFNGAAVTY